MILRSISLKATLITSIMVAALFIAACGSSAEETQAPPDTAVPPPAAVADPTAVPDTSSTTPGGAIVAPTPTQRAAVPTRTAPTPTPTPAGGVVVGELVTDRLIVVLDPPSLESPLDCEVTGSGTVYARTGAEYLIEADRFTGAFAPMLSTEWNISEDGRTWNFKLQEGVPWHFGYGEFTADDVVHSMAYYTNDDCRASYSDYFRNDPGADVEIISDYEVNMHMKVRPAVDFTYWLSAYRGVPMSSKAQWDEGCPNGAADYVGGYCVGGRDAVFAQPSRTGPYEFISFEEGVGWEFEAVDYDHYRVNGDFPIIEFKDVSEAATRLAIMLAREGHIAAINRSLLQEAVDDGLEVIDSSVTANTAFVLFGGMYHDSSIRDSLDPTRPWTLPGEAGKMVRMAMNKSINRDQINEAIYDGLGERQWVATLSPAFPAGANPAWADSWDELYGYDPVRARELLGEAGFPNGFAFEIPVFPLSGVPELPDMMEAIAAMWEDIGLQPTLVPTEFSRWREKYRGLETQCCPYAFRGPAAPIDTRVHFYFSPERFFRGYTSDAITEKKALALASLSQSDADALWVDVSDEIFYEVGTMPGWSLPVNAVVDPNVVQEYVFLGPNGGNYISLEFAKGVRE